MIPVELLLILHQCESKGDHKTLYPSGHWSQEQTCNLCSNQIGQWVGKKTQVEV